MNRTKFFTKISCDWSSIVIRIVVVSRTTSRRELYDCPQLVATTLRPMPIFVRLATTSRTIDLNFRMTSLRLPTIGCDRL